MTRFLLRWLPCLLLLAAAACAPKKLVTVPVVTTPRFPDFVEPLVPRDLASRPAATTRDRAWRFLQAGDLRNADREVSAALKIDPAFYPLDTVAGYIDLARNNNRSALTKFDRALGRSSNYLSALVGKGQALSALEREEEALAAFQAALAINSALPDVQRRVEVLQFKTVQRQIAVARQAVRSNKPDEAMRAYRAAIESSPESAFLYRELAAIERTQGDAESALTHYRRANALDASDAPSLVAMAELLADRDDFDGALKAYAAALALDPNPRVEEARARLTERAEVARLPAEYRAIATAPQITRGDLAALIGQRLGGLLNATRPRDVGVITDIRGHWAERWILAVARAGVLDPLPNHTFQPRAVVRRGDFAQAITRLLAKVAVVSPAEARRWTGARGRFTDMAPSHLAYAAASAATASGVMTTTADGGFQPNRVVTGEEAIAALDRISQLSPPRVVAGQR